MTDKIIVHGYSCGVIVSQELEKDTAELFRQEWAKQGYVTWTTCPSDLNNQESHSF